MPLESADILQLAGALLGALLIFVAAYAAPMRISIGLLLVLIPFQPVDTRLGSANVVMTYVLAGALMLRGRLKFAPTLGAMLAVLFAYLISISQLPKSLYVLHGLEVVALVSGMLVFILAYNMARESSSPRQIVDVLIVANLLSLAYCAVQLGVGPGESLKLFGADELAFNKNRGGGEARLVGPFGSPGITAAYFMSMTLILVHEAFNSRAGRRLLVASVSAGNVAMMMATANRGSFLVLLAGLLWLLFAFRKRIGFARVVLILSASTVILIGSAAVVSRYTDFANIFERLATTTETEKGLPSTRAVVWPFAFEHIQKKPLLGHGPRLMSEHERRFIRVSSNEQLIGPYPHNLYLYLLLTVGVLGTTCMLFWLLSVLWRVHKGARGGRFDSDYDKGLVLVGVIVLSAFLIDQLKIEFLRTGTVDYAHFVFALFGLFLGLADRALHRRTIVSEASGVRRASTPHQSKLASAGASVSRESGLTPRGSTP